MPDAAGNFKGAGWSQKRSDAWERVFGRGAKLRAVLDCPNGHGPREWRPVWGHYRCVTEGCDSHALSGQVVHHRMKG